MRLAHVVRAGVAVAAAVAAALAFPAVASAHVTVNPSTATQGGYTKVTFRVPNERDDASTVKLEIALPTDKPVASVSLKPIQGWTAVSESIKLATPIKTADGELVEVVSKITWTADAGSAIKPHQFQEFDVSMGPLPQTDQFVFKALQTYSSGETVRWIDEPAAGAEAEHPAPTLKLTPKAAASGAPAAPAGAAPDDGGDGTGAAVGLGVAGLVLGLAGLVVGLLAYRRAAARTS
ncbi:YcnI family protein [Dactylosporangium roseum]|uniref:YcnI family protein n=1 Tax=Dactylosporangium roseum TaxID=47989 RepID=A0ABY5YZF5_9ACTN|nr:YcnI family protein [Dactylosporangium roseum]UWZ35135.1 YcnI family protein [Dactylosporangium roseum]